MFGFIFGENVKDGYEVKIDEYGYEYILYIFYNKDGYLYFFIVVKVNLRK